MPGSAELLSVPVGAKPFGELTLEDVRAHAARLGEAGGFGHRSRAGAVASAWRRLAGEMEQGGAVTVADLEPTVIAELAEPLWITPPGGSLLP